MALVSLVSLVALVTLELELVWGLVVGARRGCPVVPGRTLHLLGEGQLVMVLMMKMILKKARLQTWCPTVMGEKVPRGPGEARCCGTGRNTW